ncbi:MAG: 50S ribosomal protein L35 [Phycisphaerae bacterium]|nr:50S ribosomal protein L35 [Phycisphaerae bacterium]
MPKPHTMKTHKGLAKRMRKTRNGKVIRNRANRGHLMSGKSGQRKRRLRRKDTVKTAQAKVYARALGT